MPRCKAINPASGWQCNRSAGHGKPHLATNPAARYVSIEPGSCIVEPIGPTDKLEWVSPDLCEHHLVDRQSCPAGLICGECGAMVMSAAELAERKLKMATKGGETDE